MSAARKTDSTAESAGSWTRRTLAGALIGLSVAVLGWVVRDYRQWRALGPGGVPSTPAGWLVVTGMRLRARDPYASRRSPSSPASSALGELAERPGPRPRVAPHPVPHRVVTQHAGPDRVSRLQAILETMAERDDELQMCTSGWEKHHQALWRRKGTEIGHVHPRDGSMHVVLATDDAAVVVARGWGEFHPLAGVMLDLPEGYVLLYPPQDDEQIGHLTTILDSAVTCPA